MATGGWSRVLLSRSSGALNQAESLSLGGLKSRNLRSWTLKTIRKLFGPKCCLPDTCAASQLQCYGHLM